MSNQEYEKAIGFLVTTCVGITLIWLLLKCVSSLFSRPQPQYVSTYSNESSSMNMRLDRELATRARDEGLIRSKKILAIDTESIGAGPRGNISMLARVSLVTRDGRVYDKYVKPTLPVTDYRTFVSGIRPIDLVDAEDYYQVKQTVAYLIKGSILVGHDVQKDLDSLKLTHPPEDLRDTSTFEPFKQIFLVKSDIFKNAMKTQWMYVSHYDPLEFMTNVMIETNKRIPKNQKMSLKWLAKHILKKDIQVGEHSSVEDARATLDLYLKYEEDWEAQILNTRILTHSLPPPPKM